MIKFLFLTIPNQYTYEQLKNPISFKQDIYGVTTWTMKHPLTIFSGDLKMKHIFKHNEVKVEGVTNPVLEQKWRYFVITKKDGGKYYCTSQIIYQKGLLRLSNLSQSQFFGSYDLTNNLNCQQYYLPRCIVLISQLPYFKLQVNLLKIHKELKKQQPAISHCIEEDLYEMYLEYLETGREKQWEGLNINDIKCKRRTFCPLQLSFSYYVQCCNSHDLGECIYIEKTTSRQVLHLYKLYPSSLYQIGYFFHLPLSSTTLRKIVSGILTQKQIVFSSSNANLTVMVIETLMQMILPLKWCYMYAPNLPVQLIQAAQESFMPYIVGVSKQHLPLISKTNKIIVHIDTDQIQAVFQQQQQQLRLLSKKFQKLLQWKSNSNKQYLQWQKQLRINSILLITTIFKKDLPLDKQHYEKKYQSQEEKHSQQKFYQEFLSKSMMYRKLIQDLHEKVYSQFYKLTKMDFVQRKNFLINKFNSLHSQTIYPTKSDNKKQWIKYYEKYMRYKRKSRLNRHSLSMVENSLSGIGSGGIYPMLVPFYASNVSYGLSGVGSRVDGGGVNGNVGNNMNSSTLMNRNNINNTNNNINNTNNNPNNPHPQLSTIHHHPNQQPLLTHKPQFFSSRTNQLYQSSVSTGSYSNGLKFHLGMGRNSSKDIFYSQNISTSNTKLRKQSMAMSAVIHNDNGGINGEKLQNAQQVLLQFNTSQVNNLNANGGNNNINSSNNNGIQPSIGGQSYQQQQQNQSLSSRQYNYPSANVINSSGNVINSSNNNINNTDINTNTNISNTNTTTSASIITNPNSNQQQKSNINSNNILRTSSINSIHGNYIKTFNMNNNLNNNNSFMPNLSRVNEGSFQYSSSLTSTSMQQQHNSSGNNSQQQQQYTTNTSNSIIANSNNSTNTYGITSQINYSPININNKIHYHPISNNSPSTYNMMFGNNNNINSSFINNNNNKPSHNSMIFTTNTNSNNHNISNSNSSQLIYQQQSLQPLQSPLQSHPLNQSMVASFIFNNQHNNTNTNLNQNTNPNTNPNNNIPTSPIIINSNNFNNISPNTNVNSSSHRNLPTTQSTIAL